MGWSSPLKYWGVGACLVLVSCSAESAFESSDSGTIHGFWEVVKLDGERPIRDPSITFTLDPEFPSGSRQDPRSGHRTVSGFDGCNNFSGVYVVTGDLLQSPSLISNLIGCSQDIQLQGDRFLDAVVESNWSLADGHLTFASEAGAVVVMRRMEPDGAVGVWTLAEIGGQAIEGTVSLTIWPGGRFSGYAGCWITGNYALEGDRLTMSAATSLEAATTTAPPQTNDGAPRTQEPVPALFGCETANESEQQFLAMAGSGRIEIDNNELTITDDGGTTASFRRG